MKTAILLINQGEPVSDNPSDVGEFLKRWFLGLESNKDNLINKIKASIAARLLKSRFAEAYHQQWRDQPNPSLLIGRELQRFLQDRLGEDIMVELAHQLCEPEIEACLESIQNKGCEQIIALPLLPQYNPLISGAITAKIEKQVNTAKRSLQLLVIPDYHSHPAYIEAIANSILSHWRTQQRQRFLMLIFNGCTSEHLDQQEQYQQQCIGTAHLVATILGISPDQWAIAYHSHLGKPSLLEPLANAVIHSKAKHNLKEIDVVCPGFATENMVSQQIIHKHLRKQFLAQGGEQFYYIPCLNASESHVQMLEELIRSQPGPVN